MAVKPGKYNPTLPDIELLDYKSKKRYGLKLDGVGSLQIGTISQDDTVHVRTQGKRVGDFDEQRSWKGGRGVEDLSSNNKGFWDSYNAWTLTDEHLTPTLLWQFGRGMRSVLLNLPDGNNNVVFRQLIGSYRYRSVTIAADTTFNADYARLWIRRVGNPGTLTVRLASDDGAGKPGTVTQVASVTTSTITDYISVFQLFNWTGTQGLNSGSTYHIYLEGASGDNGNNHWEVGGYDPGTAGGFYSSNGSTWNPDNFRPFYYVADADVARTFKSFELDGAFYVVDIKDSGVSQLWINGDRGRASAGSTTVLTDSGKSWTSNRWLGAYVKIVRGTGAGQISQISSNNATQLAVSFTTAPSTDSEYVIYGTKWFTEIGTTGLANVYSQPVVSNQIVYFPQGGSGAIRRMIWTGTAHAFSDDSTNSAHFLHVAPDSAGAIRVWRADNSLSAGSPKVTLNATAAAWANPPTALSFANTTYIGDATYPITSMTDKDGLLYVFKEDGPRTVTNDSRVISLKNGMDKTPSRNNGRASLVHQQFLYYSWLHTLIRVYGSSHDDIGQDFRSHGLPSGREGVFASLDGYMSLLICGIDAGTGTSSVLGFDGIGWHEMFRAYDSNKRIRFVKVQACEDTRNKLWIDVGGDLVYQDLPLQKASPRLDSGARYMHEAVVESSTIDMGTASALAKFIKELTVYAENLRDGNEIRVDYQVDDDIHSGSWTNATTLFTSPESTAFLGLGNIRKFAYRLRIISSNPSTPVDIRGAVPNGYARVPYKMVWTLRCRADNITAKGRLVKPDELMRWLLDNARYPGRVEMRSQYQLAHKYFVIVHPPRMFPYKPAQNGQAEEAIFTIVLEES